MTIATLIKYVDSLKARQQLYAQKMSQLSNTKTQTRVISTGTDTTVLEDSFPTISVKDFTDEYNTLAKELRLAQAALENANHTTEVNFVPNEKF
jgi:hypothetical protein